MSIDKEEVVIPAACQGTNCGTTTCEHSAECLAEAARDQGWDQLEEPEVVGVTDTFDIIWNQPIGSTIADGTELMTVAQYRAHMAAMLAENAMLKDQLRQAGELVVNALEGRGKPVAYTTQGMLDIAKELPLTGRIGAKVVADERWNVPLYASAQQATLPECAEQIAFVLRQIGSMDADDITGDDVDLRFEDEDGQDTGCDVSIVEYTEKAADLIDELRAQFAQTVHSQVVDAALAEQVLRMISRLECHTEPGSLYRVRIHRLPS